MEGSSDFKIVIPGFSLVRPCLLNLQLSCLEEVWHLVDEEANKPWEYGSGKPLFRCSTVVTTSRTTDQCCIANQTSPAEDRGRLCGCKLLSPRCRRRNLGYSDDQLNPLQL